MATQRTSFTDTPNACFNAGRASWTMLASSCPMNAPIQVMPTTSQGWKDWRSRNAAGGGSTPRRTSHDRKRAGAVPSDTALARQLVFQRHLARAFDPADGGAAGRHELAGDHAASRDDHAFLQCLAVLAEL